MSKDVERKLLFNTYRLLEAIDTGNWEEYQQLCDEGMSCFEPEAKGHLVQGMEFHRFFFDFQKKKPPLAPVAGKKSFLSLGASSSSSDSATSSLEIPAQSIVSSPVVKFLGDNVAIVSYVRLVQKIEASPDRSSFFPVTRSYSETRIWNLKDNGNWRVVHFHRSLAE